MKITAKLALNQLKINRSRTIWSLIAIALSTALIVTVCSFVSSGSATLVSLLGDGYGDYGGTYTVMLLAPASFFILLIMAMTIVVISNVFKVSANERIAEFGILKCVGTTEKQISSIVFYESIFLSFVGIPIGVILGLMLTFVAINIVNVYLNELNELVHIMINEISFSLELVFSWQMMLLAAIICFFTVLISAYKPGRKAAKASAVDSVRGANTVKVGKKKRHTNPIIGKILGFEGEFASKNISRNKQNFKATVTALTVGVVLIVSLGGLSNQGYSIMEYSQLPYEQTIISEYVSYRFSEMNETTGRQESIYAKPISAETGNEVAEKLREYDDIDVLGLGFDNEKYYANLSDRYITDDMAGVISENPQESYELEVEIIVIDNHNYKLLCEKIGVPIGSNILINYYSHNDNGTLVDLAPYHSDLKEITLIEANGSETKINIDAMITKESMPDELFYINIRPMRLILPEAESRGYSWLSTPENEEDFIDYANMVLAGFFPSDENAEYMDEGFSTRVYRTDEYSQVMNMAIVLVLVFVNSFAILLILIGLTNVVSTLYTNVFIRAREFAVLQSMGMTPKGLKKMLIFESLLCSTKALFRGAVIGIVISYGINIPIKAIWPIAYNIPFDTIILCCIAVSTITLGVTVFAVRKLSKQNIIETIRMAR